MTEYDADILDWSRHQAGLLRRAAVGERVNGLDWHNIIEEIESVGRSQLSAVRCYIVLALLHDLKVEAWPQARDVPHWRAEAIGFRQQLLEAYAPSMRQHVDMAALYANARRRLPGSVDGMPPLSTSEHCLVTLDDLLGSA